MLSSQTKDEVTDNAVKQLRSALGGAISVAAVIDADDQTISDAINKVGFWRRKTQLVSSHGHMALWLIAASDTFNKLQSDFEMTSIQIYPRPRMNYAHCLVLVPKWLSWRCRLLGNCERNSAFLSCQPKGLTIGRRNLGIGVDVHVHRITNRLGWHKPPTKTPEDTRYCHIFSLVL